MSKEIGFIEIPKEYWDFKTRCNKCGRKSVSDTGFCYRSQPSGERCTGTEPLKNKKLVN